MNIETCQHEILGNFPGMSFSPRFSPDSQRVIFSLQRGGNSNLFVMDLRSEATARVTDTQVIDTAPSYSPDGTRITFESDRGGQQQIPVYISLGEVTPASNPRTFKLLEAGTRKIAQKVIEEAGEVALEAVKHHDRGVVRESADLLYHLVVLWCRAGIEPASVWQEMQARADTLGIAEKLPKAR